ncbi:hypothetical protein [Vibrio hangzhouensis]|uniref:Uncharacterized protein n=1 Tax=Vibrio hangzhouensis TaxID=462991 RepID=A0A1H6B3G0_9VIBR|nr:hypothetical protein [Vibrio hangzhouensis]SEG55142.1 hypothetical protein SAMN04488244_11914 [Vibrio hangzhouensis]
MIKDNRPQNQNSQDESLWHSALFAGFTFILLRFVLPNHAQLGSQAETAIIEIAANYALAISTLWFIPPLAARIRRRKQSALQPDLKTSL